MGKSRIDSKTAYRIQPSGGASGFKTINSNSILGTGDIVISTSAITQRALHVMPTIGNDTTGTAYDLTKPYATIEGALVDAVAGDTIVVWESVTVTTTAATGIWKDGVNYVVMNNATITKTSAGTLFGFSAPTIDFSLKGNARFSFGGAVGYFASGANLPINIEMEYDRIDQTAYSTYNLYTTTSKTIRLKYNSIVNSGGTTYYNIGGGQLFIDFVKDSNTISWWLNIVIYTKFLINGTEVICTSSNAVLSTYLTEGTFNISWCEGAPYGYDCQTNPYNAYGAIRIFGRTNYINNNHYDVVHVGQTNYLRNYGNGVLQAGTVHITATILGGEVECTLSEFYSSIFSKLSQSGGTSKIKILSGAYFPSISVSGGVCEIQSGIFSYSYGYFSATANSGGTIICKANIIYATTGASYVNNNRPFVLNGGTLKLENCSIYNRANDSDKAGGIEVVTCVDFISGTLIVNGATLKNTLQEVPVIRARNSGLNIKVLSGGLSTNNVTNGGTITGKKQKVKYTISTVAVSSLTINGTVHTTTLLTTKADIAAELLGLVNAGAQNGVVIATQDTPGTDEYIYVEALVDGVAYTYAYSNITETQIRPNSYAITNITGGTIIDDVDVE